MPADSLLFLAAGRLSVRLAPSFGGSIARLDFTAANGEKVQILRGVEGYPTNILDVANFPLVPFCNRVRDGRFAFRRRNVTLAKNLPGDASPLHGQGWLAAWEIAAANAAGAELVYRHEPDEWPWRYEARQFFDLDPQGLAVTLACTNLSGEPMPGGLGLHPYFPCTRETRLDTGVETVWTIDANVLPVEQVPATGRYDLADRLVCGQDLDNGFGGWSGRARIDDPASPFGLELSSPDARFFHLYSPPEGGLFAAEPASHANAALNAPEEGWPELGMRVLEPGETMSLAMRIDVFENQ